jgi:micrococcal nuclease
MMRVIDGDTIEVSVHLWPGLTQLVSVRVEGIDTPERNGAPCERRLAEAAARFVRNWTGIGSEIVISGVEPDKYAGRVVATVRRMGSADSLGPALVSAGHAREYLGGKRGRWC